jgi:hypothetical protein
MNAKRDTGPRTPSRSDAESKWFVEHLSALPHLSPKQNDERVKALREAAALQALHSDNGHAIEGLGRDCQHGGVWAHYGAIGCHRPRPVLGLPRLLPQHRLDTIELTTLWRELSVALKRVALIDNETSRAFLATVPARLNQNETWFVLRDIGRLFPQENTP